MPNNQFNPFVTLQGPAEKFQLFIGISNRKNNWFSHWNHIRVDPLSLHGFVLFWALSFLRNWKKKPISCFSSSTTSDLSLMNRFYRIVSGIFLCTRIVSISSFKNALIFVTGVDPCWPGWKIILVTLARSKTYILRSVFPPEYFVVTALTYQWPSGSTQFVVDYSITGCTYRCNLMS